MSAELWSVAERLEAALALLAHSEAGACFCDECDVNWGVVGDEVQALRDNPPPPETEG